MFYFSTVQKFCPVQTTHSSSFFFLLVDSLSESKYHTGETPKSEYVYFNDGKYVNDDIEMSPTENENHPHTYVNKIEKTNQGLAQCHVYEAVYHKPSATQDENSTSMHANFDDGNIVVRFLK